MGGKIWFDLLDSMLMIISSALHAGFLFGQSGTGLSAGHTAGEAVASRARGSWIDHLAYLCDARGWKPADFGVLPDDAFVLRQIDAEGLIGGDVAVDPLDVRAQATQHLVRFLCRRPELLALKAADAWNIAFDYKFTECHWSSSGVLLIVSVVAAMSTTSQTLEPVRISR
jgi:hypothetical protein